MSRYLLAGSAMALLISCGDADVSETNEEAAPATPLADPPVPADRLIEVGAVGGVPAGGTLENFRAAMPEADFEYFANYIVDLSALCVAEGEHQDALCALTWFAPAEEPNATVELLQAHSPEFRTAAGVGPGMTISAAEEIYGTATLSYSVENESREYVVFENGPDAIGFRTSRPSAEDVPESFAGIYEDTPTPVPTTQVYHPDAVIESVEVITPFDPSVD